MATRRNMTKTKNYLVLKGHIYAPRVRARRGLVIALDPEELQTRRGVANRQLVETSRPVTGELEDMGPRLEVQDELLQEASGGTDEVERIAADLISGPVAHIEAAAKNATEEVLIRAMELEQGRPGGPRQGAKAAITTALDALEGEGK